MINLKQLIVGLTFIVLNNILISESASCSTYSTQSSCDSNSQCSWIYGGSSYYCACASSVAEDVYFVMDDSGSIGSTGWSEDLTFVEDMVSTGLTNTSRVGLITFSSSVSVKYNLTQTQHPRSVVTTAVANLAYTGGSTYTKSAVQVAINMFKKYSTTGNPRLLFLITDGIPNPSTAQSPCSLYPTISAQNITVFIVGVGTGFSSTPVDCLVTSSSYIVLASSFSNLASVRDYTDNVLCPSTIELTLTEVRVVTDGTSSAQFIEFYNSGSSVINLKTNPLKLSGLVTGTLNSSIKANISAGQYVVLYKSGTSPICYDCSCTQYSNQRCKNALYIPCDGKNCTFNTLYKSASVSNSNWGVVIQDGSDNSVAVNVSTSFGGTWPSIYSGYSFELQSLTDNDASASSWGQSCWDYGTPGQGPLSTCSSCKAAVCQANGDSSASCSGNSCDCTESNDYYYYSSSCYKVPNVTNCATTIGKDSGGTYVDITWDDVTVSATHWFQVQYPSAGAINYGTTSPAYNEHFYVYYDSTVTASSTTPQVQVIVYDNTSSLTQGGSRVVFGSYVPCPISTASPTIAPTPEPTVGVPNIPSCNATLDGYNSITVEWQTATINYPYTPASISSYKIYVTCNGVNTSYHSSTRAFTNTITGCTITSSSSISRVAVAAVVDDSLGDENDSLMKKYATSCTVLTSAPTGYPTKTPTRPPTKKPTAYPTKIPTANPTYQDWLVSSCSVQIQQGSTSVSVSYVESPPTDTSNPRTIILYDSVKDSSTLLSSNPATVILSGVDLTVRDRFVVYPQFAQYPGGPQIGETCCSATCTISSLAPTPSPTGIPTRLPTDAPTHIPTSLPTSLPTASPTPQPTYADMEVAYCNFTLFQGDHNLRVYFYEPSTFTFSSSNLKYKISWNNEVSYEFISSNGPSSFIDITIPISGSIDPSYGVYVTVYYSDSNTLRQQGNEQYCTPHTQAPTPAPTSFPTTPAPTWVSPTISFDLSQFTDSCSYTEGSDSAACTLSPSTAAYSLQVLRSPSDTWGYQLGYTWSISDHRRRMVSSVSSELSNASFFSGATSGSGFIPTSLDFDTFHYTFIGPHNVTLVPTYTFTISLGKCFVNDSSYNPSIVSYGCTILPPYDVIVTADFSSSRFQTSNTVGSLPKWIWYAIAAAALVIPLLSFLGYRYYKKKKFAELLKEQKEEELKGAEEFDDAANFGGLGDEVTFNPLATGGTVDIATGGQYIDSQLESQKQQFETAHVDVDVMTFKQDFGQVQAIKH